MALTPLSGGSGVATTGMMSRDVTLDVAKGVGIILVVTGHAWRGLNNADLVGDQGLFRLIDTLIYNFHMPFFFLISGITFEALALRRSFAQTALGRMTRLLWPLLLWTYIFLLARLIVGSAANNPLAGLQDLFVWPLPPREHLWFLWALFLLHIAVLTIIRLRGSAPPRLVWGGLAGSVILIVGADLVPLNALTSGALMNAGAFLTGLALGPGTFTRPGPALATAATALFIALQWTSLHLAASTLWTQLLGILLSLSFLVMIRSASLGLPTRVLNALAMLGLASMAIYLSHTIFSAATRMLLMTEVVPLGIHLLLGTIAGLAGPLLLLAAIRQVARPSWIGF